MKTKIERLVRDYPRHYAMMMRKDPQMMEWLDANSDPLIDHFPTRVYCAIHQLSHICENGNARTVCSINEGLKGCGPAAKCECTKNSIASSVSNTKLNLPDEVKAESNAKRENTMVERYGYAFNAQRPEVKPSLASRLPVHLQNILNDRDWMEREYVENKRTTVDIAREIGVHYSTVIDHLRLLGFEIRQRAAYSLVESDIESYIQSLNFEVETSNWTILHKKEVDIYVPSVKLGIEVDGLYWHSYHPTNGVSTDDEDSNKHLNKTIDAKLVGVTLIHVTDCEWYNCENLVKSLICEKLGISTAVLANDCDVVYIPADQASAFIVDNCLDGVIDASGYIGLIHYGHIVMAIAYDITDVINVEQVVSRSFHVVSDGIRVLVDKLQHDLEKDVIVRCNRDRSDGDEFIAAGFVEINIVPPTKKWVTGNYVLPKSVCEADVIGSWLPVYDGDLSVDENLFNNQYRRYWDCGYLVFEKKYDIK